MSKEHFDSQIRRPKIASDINSDKFEQHIVHDINNLHTVISGNIELMLLSQKLDYSTQQQAKTALSAVDRANKLIKRLLIASKNKSPCSQHLQLSTVVKELKPMIKSIVGEKITLKFTERDDLPLLQINLSEFENCLFNLAANARDAMQGQGTLSIRLGCKQLTAQDGQGIKPGQYIHIQVSDTGAGISATHLPHIFEPYYTTKGPKNGNGLGLASVLSFVTQSKGFIDVETGQDIGTTFHLYLPEGKPEIHSALRPFISREFGKLK